MPTHSGTILAVSGQLPLDFYRHHLILGIRSTVMMLSEELQLLKLYRT